MNGLNLYEIKLMSKSLGNAGTALVIARDAKQASLILINNGLFNGHREEYIIENISLINTSIIYTEARMVSEIWQKAGQKGPKGDKGDPGKDGEGSIDKDAIEKALGYTPANDNELSVVSKTGSYNDLLNKPSIPSLANYYDKTQIDNTVKQVTDKIPTATSQLTNNSGFITSAYHDNTKQDVINESNKLNYSLLSNAPSIPTKVSDLDIDIPLGAVDDVKVGGVSVVTNKVANITVPTKTSELTNDSEYITNGDYRLTNKREPIAHTHSIDDISGSKETVNLPFEIIPNTYISNANGSQLAYNGWSSTDYIDIHECDLVTVNGSASNYCAVYSENKTFLRAINVTGSGFQFIPTDAYYFRYSAASSAVTSLVVIGEVKGGGSYFDQFAKKTDLEDYATKEYVDSIIDEINNFLDSI